MLIAQFYFGPFDGKRLILPTEEPWPRFVIPKFDSLLIEHFYLFAGQVDQNLYAYLFDQNFSTVTEESL